MKIRTFMVPLLVGLVASTLSPAKSSSQEPVVQATPLVIGQKIVLETVPNNRTELRVYSLKHASAVVVARLISNVLRVAAHENQRTNSVFVNATREQMESIDSLVMELDVPAQESAKPQGIQNLSFRVYMFETSAQDQGMKSFSLVLRSPFQEPYTEAITQVALRGDFQIKSMHTTRTRASNTVQSHTVEVAIQGKATGMEPLESIVNLIPDASIVDLTWHDYETFAVSIPAAQITQLPESLQRHIGSFLGEDIHTVGYWFGNSSSVPGMVQAPIGPWTLSIELQAASDRSLEFNFAVEDPMWIRPEQGQRTPTGRQILSNVIRAKTGQPIIIGYNRESQGRRKMGAMVIIPEADPFQTPAAATTY